MAPSAGPRFETACSRGSPGRQLRLARPKGGAATCGAEKTPGEIF